MELPFTVVFEPPSRSELRALLRLRRAWAAGVFVALAIGTAVFVAAVGRTDAVASGPTVPLELTSRPAGAAVWLDGRERGRTPLTVQTEPGPHGALLKARGAVDAEYTLHVGGGGAAVDAVLWRRDPALTRLRPALPGAALADVRFLADGRLALSIGVPPDHQMQAWRLDPSSGALEPVLTEITATRLSVSPDGQRVAFSGYPVGPPSGAADPSESTNDRATVLWLSGEASTTGWRPALRPGEELVDASWSPRADRLLAVTSQELPGGAMSSRLWIVAADGQAGHEVQRLPSEIAPGSEVWSPDGQHVALVAHAGTVNALCLIDLDGGFHYVADLEPSLGAPPAYWPATWAADGQQLLFVAPHQHPPRVPFGWLQADPQRALYVASAADPTPRVVGDTDVDFAAWREGGQVIGLGRLGTNHALAVRLLAGSASGQRLLELPVSPAPAYAAVWDLARARLLLASPTSAGGVEYWLAMFGLEDAP